MVGRLPKICCTWLAFWLVSTEFLSKTIASAGTPSAIACRRMASALDGPLVSWAAPENISFGAQPALNNFMASAARAGVSPPLMATMASAGAHLATKTSGAGQSFKSSITSSEFTPITARTKPTAIAVVVVISLNIYCLYQQFGRLLDLFLGSLPAQRQTQTTGNSSWRQANSLQNVRCCLLVGRAGRAGAGH